MRRISISHPFPHSLTKVTLRMSNYRNQKTLNQSPLAFYLYPPPHLLIPPQPQTPPLPPQPAKIKYRIERSHSWSTGHPFLPLTLFSPHPSLSPQLANLPPQPAN